MEKNTIDVNCSGKRRHHTFSAILNRILAILAGNKDIHKSLDEFEFRPDPTTAALSVNKTKLMRVYEYVRLYE